MYSNPVNNIGGEPYGYTGEWFESYIDLLFLRARWYAPETGTFLNVDPVGSEPPYAYVGGNPVNRVDPSGLKNYRIGHNDPHVSFDPGAGPHNSETPTLKLRSLKATILAKPTSLIAPNALEHLQHYLGNSGDDYQIDLEDMLNEVPSAQYLYNEERDLAKKFAETLKGNPNNDSYRITSGSASSEYNHKSENWDWFYAVGGYSSWGKGSVTIKCWHSGVYEYTLNFKYKFIDRYNWDIGKSVPIFGVVITDKFMGDFHRQGLAKEFTMYGEVEETLRWYKR